MPNGTNLIPGLDSYMDTEITVDVNLGNAAEEVKEEAEAVETATDVESAETEGQEDAIEAEMIFNRFVEFMDMQTHISKYGVSRDWFAWINRDGSLTRTLNLNIPSMDAIDSVSNPNTALSLACASSLNRVTSSSWDFMKRVCARQNQCIGSLLNKVACHAVTIDKRLNRLQTICEDTELTSGNVSVRTYDLRMLDYQFNELHKLQKELSPTIALCQKALNSLHTSEQVTAIAQLQDQVKKLQQINSTLDRAFLSMNPVDINISNDTLCIVTDCISNLRKKNSLYREFNEDYNVLTKMISQLGVMIDTAQNGTTSVSDEQVAEEGQKMKSVLLVAKGINAAIKEMFSLPKFHSALCRRSVATCASIAAQFNSKKV